MPIIALDCKGCGAKLKIKAGLARTPAEVKCPKCGKMIPVSKDGAASSPAAEPASAVAPVQTPEAAPAAPTPPPIPVPEPDPAAPEESVPEPEVPAPPPVPAPVAPPPPPPPPVPVVADAPAPAPGKPVPAPEPPPVPQASSAAPRKAAAPIVLSHLGEQHGAVTVPVKCPACHWQTKVREELIGKKIRCKQCAGIIPVVAPDGFVPAAVAATSPSPAVAPAAVPAVPAVEPIQALKPVPVQSTADVAPVLVPVSQAVVAAPVEPAAMVAAPAPVPAPAAPAAEIEVFVREVAALKSELLQLREQREMAERRAVTAEKACHDQAQQRAMDQMSTRRRLAELEAQISVLRSLLAEIRGDVQSELQAATQRVSLLQQRLTRLG